MKKNNYAYIDSQNLNLGIQKVGFKLDWTKFYALLTKKYGVKKAYLFIGYVAENEPMYEQLHSIGYSIVLKPTVEMLLTPEQKVEREEALAKRAADENKEDHKTTMKGNIDAEMVLQAMIDYPDYGGAIIVSGDGDFFCLVEYLEKKGKLAHLMVPNWQRSMLLKPFEAKTIRLDLMKRQLSYRPFKSKKPRTS